MSEHCKRTGKAVPDRYHSDMNQNPNFGDSEIVAVYHIGIRDS